MNYLISFAGLKFILLSLFCNEEKQHAITMKVRTIIKEQSSCPFFYLKPLINYDYILIWYRF